MRRRASPRVAGYAILAGAGLVSALALRRPELAVAAAPFAVLLALGLRLARDPDVRIGLELAAERTLEGSPVAAEVTVAAETRVDRLDLMLDLPDEVEVADAEPARAIRLGRGEERSLHVDLCSRRWGVYDVGGIEARARDVFRLVVWERRVELHRTLKAYPKEERVQRLLTPFETRALTGSEVARAKGDGIEYADIRDYVPGDRMRSINWRASARRVGLVVNERHPERNTDVVLFVDSFSDLQGATRSTLDDAVRAAATLATRYLDRRDRVGLVAFGGVLRWRADLRLAGRQRHPRPDPASEGARRRTHAARRSPVRRGARGSPRARLRPRGRRDRPRRRGRPREKRDRTPCVPPLAPAAGDASLAALAPRHRCLPLA
jgi:uncharacterized protein (DUF58 family)